MKTENISKKLSPLQRGLTLLAGLLLISVLFVPLWRIELVAPQYPEGLILKMHPHKLAGDVEIINGLNHYIGMKTLHTQDFIEFTLLPYIIGGFALLCMVVAAINRKKSLWVLVVGFIIFGIISIIDFYRWNYNYGHNLDPNAPIQVPGMSYQPPLVGFKQLLNFGAYSIPDVGGWLFICSGLLLATALGLSFKKNKVSVSKPIIAFTWLALTFTSCQQKAEPIRLGKDACAFCKMTIMHQQFGAELISNKGKVFKFDDTHCLQAFLKETPQSQAKIWMVSHSSPYDLLPAQEAFYLKSAALHSPMGGNIAAFPTEADLNKVAHSIKEEKEKITWEQVVLP